MIKKLIGTCITATVLAVTGKVVSDYAETKPALKNVNDYNELVDRYNEMSDFIDNCNFYTYKNPKASDKNTRFVTETQTRQDGSIQTVKHDRATGFTIISSNDA